MKRESVFVSFFHFLFLLIVAVPPTCISSVSSLKNFINQSVANRTQISVNQIIYYFIYYKQTNNVFEPTCDLVLVGAALLAPDRQASVDADPGSLEPLQFFARTKGSASRTSRLLLQRPRHWPMRASNPSLPKMPGKDHSAQLFTPRPFFKIWPIKSLIGK